MNLTSHEYVGCQIESHNPLIISEFAGSYSSFAGAIRVNPWDYQEVSEGINEALSMPEEEKVQKHQELYRYVAYNSANHWVNTYLKDSELDQLRNVKIPPKCKSKKSFVREDKTTT
eukprot:Lithocolla_globosa_v1_NODE_8_length_11455_cov_155.660175.p9 type:complete len:116 gc:universal NODE_8_length_11455_cov_155.660175:10376-10029(-)